MVERGVSLTPPCARSSPWQTRCRPQRLRIITTLRPPPRPHSQQHRLAHARADRMANLPLVCTAWPPADQVPILLRGLRGWRHRRSRLQYARAARRLRWLPGLNPPTLSPHAVCAMARAHASLVHGSGLVASAAACRALDRPRRARARPRAGLPQRYRYCNFGAPSVAFSISPPGVTARSLLFTRAAKLVPSCPSCPTPPAARRG